MSYKALLLGSIGVVTETSDIQRRAFNTAFETCEIDWHWDADLYRSLLTVSGGKARLRHFAERMDVEVDIDAIYQAKVNAFEAATHRGLSPRPGVVNLIEEAIAQQIQVGFVTSTDPRQVGLILGALNPTIVPSMFSYLGDSHKVRATKPAPDIYFDALHALNVAPGEALAIEDTPESASAALAAGIETIAYPGEAARERAFGPRVTVLDTLDRSLIQSAQAA